MVEEVVEEAMTVVERGGCGEAWRVVFDMLSQQMLLTFDTG